MSYNVVVKMERVKRIPRRYGKEADSLRE
jgi:hypothetical protein